MLCPSHIFIGGNLKMNNILQKASEAATYINSKIDCRPRIAIILGSGLGELADE